MLELVCFTTSETLKRKRMDLRGAYGSVMPTMIAPHYKVSHL